MYDIVNAKYGKCTDVQQSEAQQALGAVDSPINSKRSNESEIHDWHFCSKYGYMKMANLSIIVSSDCAFGRTFPLNLRLVTLIYI